MKYEEFVLLIAFIVLQMLNGLPLVLLGAAWMFWGVNFLIRTARSDEFSNVMFVRLWISGAVFMLGIEFFFSSVFAFPLAIVFMVLGGASFVLTVKHFVGRNR